MITKIGVRWVRSLDVRIVLIVLLIAVSTGHVGRLFADREDDRQAFVGYLLAFAIDGVMAVSLFEVANVRKSTRKAFALFVFVFACVVSGGFNYAYYRQNYPGDPELISGLLGLTAPLLAALLSVLKAMGDNQRTETEQSVQERERSLELERYTLELAEQTKREQSEQAERTERTRIEQAEQTKRTRANARAEQAKANAEQQVKANVQTEQKTNGRRKPGELDEQARAILALDPDIGIRPLARQLGVAPSTASGVLKRVRTDKADNGKGAN